jgi:hypothetical protein
LSAEEETEVAMAQRAPRVRRPTRNGFLWFCLGAGGRWFLRW